MFPTKIKIEDNEKLYIKWDDDVEDRIKLKTLRENCPSAISKAERQEQGDSYIPIFFGDQLKVESIKLVGNYAINIAWKDGHNTGIYTFKQLKDLAEKDQL